MIIMLIGFCTQKHSKKGFQCMWYTIEIFPEKEVYSL